MFSPRCGAVLALAAAPLLAQVPAHATQLNPATIQMRPTLVQDGDVVHAFACGYPTIYHARSTDGGRTWPIREQGLGTFFTAAPFSVVQEHAVPVAVHAGVLLVASHDMTFGPRVVRSLDGGITWSTPVNLATAVTLQSDSLRTRLYANGSNLVVVWWNNRPNGRIFCNRSSDFGLTWQPVETVLDAANPQLVQWLVVGGTGPNVHAIWHDGTMHHQRSTDGGVTWLPTAVGLPGAVAFEPAIPLRFASHGAARLLLSTNGLLRSSDGGNTWSHVSSHGIPAMIDIANDGPLTVAVGSNTNLSVYLVNVSTDAGASWQPMPLQLGASAPTNVRAYAYVDHGIVYVNWELNGYPGNVIRSDDFGASWQVIDGPVQAGYSPGPTRAIHTALTWTSTNYYHVYVGSGSSRLGQGTAGSGGAVPNLTTEGLPVRGRSTGVLASGLLGGAPSGLGISFQPPGALPFVGGIVHLATLDVLLPFLTTGAPNQPGTGTFAASIAIPNLATLVGTRLVLQGIAIDAGANGGLSLTNGLELWLR